MKRVHDVKYQNIFLKFDSGLHRTLSLEVN